MGNENKITSVIGHVSPRQANVICVDYLPILPLVIGSPQLFLSFFLLLSIFVLLVRDKAACSRERGLRVSKQYWKCQHAGNTSNLFSFRVTSIGV